MKSVDRLLNLMAMIMSLAATAIFTVVLVVGAANVLSWLLPVGLVALFVALALSVVTMWRRRW